MKKTCSKCNALFTDQVCPKCGSAPKLCKETDCDKPAMVGHTQCLRHFAERTVGVDYSAIDKRR